MHYNCRGFPLLTILLFVCVTWQLLGWGYEKKIGMAKAMGTGKRGHVDNGNNCSPNSKRGTKGAPRGNFAQKEFCPWSSVLVCVSQQNLGP